MSLKVVGSSSETCQSMVAAAPARDLPEGLVDRLAEGKVLRPWRIAECRRWVADGAPLDAVAVADALVRESQPDPG